MRSIWKGSISFGLVNIPVKMYSATQSHTLDLDMLRKGDLCEVKYKRVCFKSAKDTSLSMYNPSTWWKIQCERDETASLRKTLPGEIVRIGGLLFSI